MTYLEYLALQEKLKRKPASLTVVVVVVVICPPP